MKMLCLLIGAVYMAAGELIQLNDADFVDKAFETCPETTQNTCFSDWFTKHFSDKFSCFYDASGVYSDFRVKFYGTSGADVGVDDNDGVTTIYMDHYCCGYMANGLKQCDVMSQWYMVSGTHFSLCETNYHDAYDEGTADSPKLRRDLCCENEQFSDCNLCKSFMVWDFTEDNLYGGDAILEWENDAEDGKVTMSEEWRDVYTSRANQQPTFEFEGSQENYPPYAYGNKVYPLGYARGKLREFNDPPICVYAPNVGGHILEIKVEPDEIGNTVCVDDLHEDSLERNNPGVTQACDDTRLRTCIPDGAVDTSEVDGFAFLISCSESCADSDVDLWFRLRASTNKWKDAGDADLGTDRTELNTEMWCMWGISDMRNADGNFMESAGASDEVFKSFAGLDGDFSKWDRWPSDLEPQQEPRVTPIQSSSAMLSLVVACVLGIFAL